jgi:hypothetical protein
MEKVVGKPEDSPFVRLAREEERRFETLIKNLTAGL